MHSPSSSICNQFFGGYILAYHNLPSDLFEKQIDSLAPDIPVSLSEIVSRINEGKSTSGLFAITVDDGVGKTAKELSEVCIRRKWPITYFIPTGYVNQTHLMAFQLKDKIIEFLPKRKLFFEKKEYDLQTKLGQNHFLSSLSKSLYTKNKKHYFPFLEELANEIITNGLARKKQLKPPSPISWEEVNKLGKEPYINFGSHGISHTALSALSNEEVIDEALNSQKIIAEHTNKPCEHFCYPYGGIESIGSMAPEIIRKIYKSAVTMKRGRLNNKDLLKLPRIPIHFHDSINETRLKIIIR
jgi:peptidoglycan/xylan/chitin deacetylase (PgdA/CDA1 family)